MCGATWQQTSVKEHTKDHVVGLIQWTFFWFVLFLGISGLFFAPDAMMKIWPAVSSFYEALGLSNNSSGCFSIQNLSNFFVMKNDTLYMGLKGEIVNTSDEVKNISAVTVLLCDDEGVSKNDSYKKTWTHNLTYKKLLPNQKVVFETELQRVPCNNLLCYITLDAL
jgi:hypothetical protein